AERRGRCQVADLPPGRVLIDVVAPGRVPLRKDGVTLEPGRSTDLGRLTLAPAVVAQGRTVDEAGHPVAGATVEARSLEGGAPAPGAPALSAEDGRFSLALP